MPICSHPACPYEDEYQPVQFQDEERIIVLHTVSPGKKWKSALKALIEEMENETN